MNKETVFETAAAQPKQYPLSLRKQIDLISVVVPVYNVQAKLLRACLDSLIAQTLRPNEFEIVIVDDCSHAPETLCELDRFVSHCSNARLVRHVNNLGLNEARYSGVKASRGDYVIFVDGDDILTRDALENLRIEAANKQADIVTAPFLRWNSNNYTYSYVPITAEPFPAAYVDRLEAALSAQRSFTMCGRLFRREILIDGVHDLPHGQLHEDVTTFIRALFRSKVVAHASAPIYYYTFNPGSITRNFTGKHAEGMLASLEDWVRCSREAGLFTQLSHAMAQGAERMVNVCVERCVFSSGMAEQQKAEVLGYLHKRYVALPLPRLDPKLSGIKLLLDCSDELRREPRLLLQKLSEYYPSGVPAHMKPPPPLKYGLAPSEMARRLLGKIVFVGQVDYHVRNAAALATCLTEAGYACAILDNSAIVGNGTRNLNSAPAMPAGIDYIKVEKCPYEADWLATAKLVIVFNDHNNEIREALEYRHRLALPSACMIEGICDFLRADFDDYRHYGYRRCDYVLLAGDNDRKYFPDRRTSVVGLPVIEELSRKRPAFPGKPLAVLNVNFTYGALEHERDGFVQQAKAAFDALGLNWTITQHPMDKGELAGLPVSSKTQYELIDECSVFVSRFATGILEALASGKPAIYFNPHGEKTEKFKDPMGGFYTASTPQELTIALRQALNDIAAGVDFRKRALHFLTHHTAYAPGAGSVAQRFTATVKDILQSTDQQYQTLLAFLSERLTALETAERPPPPAPVEPVATPQRLAFYAPFGNWLAQRAPDWFSLLRIARRAALALWRRRAVTLPAAILLMALPMISFMPGLEANRPLVLGAAAFLIAMATIIYVGLRMYQFALSSSAETRRLADQIATLDGRTAALAREIDRRFAAATKEARAHDDALRKDVEASLRTHLVQAALPTQALTDQNDMLAQAVDALRTDGERFRTTLAYQRETVDALAKAAEHRQIALRAELIGKIEGAVDLANKELAYQRETVDALAKAAEHRQIALRAELLGKIEGAVDLANKDLAKERINIERLRDRVTAGERQIGALRYPEAPSIFVFFGHHKCASRFFRLEVFTRIAELNEARTRRYQIKNPPFHYSRMDELDLCNIDFSGLGNNGRDVVWFANATERCYEKIRASARNWKGLRVLRDPRQILVSNYFHHKGDHPDVAAAGWVWDQLVRDKPVLRELPEEQGLLYELDNITRQVIEEQILAPMDDERILTIKVEDFSQDPGTYLTKIAAFLETPDIAGINLKNTHANPDSGRWQKHFTSKLRAVFKERYGQALIDLGYAEDLYW